MKILFVDTSGDDGWPDPYGNARMKNHVTLGLTMDVENWYGCAVALTNVMDRAFKNKIKRPKEFHYVDLVAGNGAYKDLKKPERKQLADDVLTIILNADVTLFALVANKKKHYEKYITPDEKSKPKSKQKSNALDPSILGIAVLIGRFDKYLERIEDKGIIVVDNEGMRRNKVKQAWTTQVMEDRGIITSRQRKDIYFKHTLYPNIIETCHFSPSEMSPGIQLADFCCYATSSKFNHRGRGKRFAEIEHLFDTTPKGNLVGIKRWPPKKK